MTYEQKLDFILNNLTPIINHKTSKELANSFIDNKIEEYELTQLLDKLKTDGNVDFSASFGYKININGKVLIENKGYCEKKRKDDRLHELSEKTFNKAKSNTRWVIATFFLTLILFILGLLIKKITGE